MLQLVKDLLSRFVKRGVIDSLVTCNNVTSFDTNSAAKHNSAGDLGFSADRIIRSEGFKKKKVSDRNMLGFRTDGQISAYSCVQEVGSEDAYQIPSSSITVLFGSSQHGFCS